MKMPIISIPDILLSSLSIFKPCFYNKPQFKNFCFYILGLILCLEARNIKDINDQLRKKNQSSLNRFLTESCWLNKKIRQKRRQLINQFIAHSKKKVVYFIIDDTVLDKTGLHIEGIGLHYSNSSKRSVRGHNLVTGICIIDDVLLPFDFFPYIKKEECEKQGIEFKTKIQLATRLIRSFVPPKGTRVIVIVDKWYCCDKVVNQAKEKGFGFLSPLKSNRIIYYQGKKYKLSDLTKAVAHAQYKEIGIDDKRFYLTSIEVEIPKIGKVCLVLNKEIKPDENMEDLIGKEPNCIISTCFDWSAKKNLSVYLLRATTENFYRDSKQHLGLGQYQMRKLKGIIKHWHLVFTAYILLILINMKNSFKGSPNTIGEICNWTRQLFFKELLIWSYQQGKMGKTIDSILTTF